MPSIQPYQHADVREFVTLPENTRIGMTETDKFVSYGGTSFYLHPEQTLRASRFIQSFPKVGADGEWHRASRWRQFLHHAQAVFQGVKASSFIKRCSGGRAAAPLEKSKAAANAARMRFETSVNVAMAAIRFGDAGARAAAQQTTAQSPVSASTSRIDVPLDSPTTERRAKVSSFVGTATLRTVAPSPVNQARRPPVPTTLPLRQPLTGTPTAQTWSSPPELTLPAERRIPS
ncbi:hypothetical protein [Pandoraea sp. PE-S2T-3]|uniref:hypothetical protein n=1 Tax=Pandoraea sp. PE-S2T-3 TaxID=1986993 RepID=UPI000B3FB5CE|nr:hypothetical protein [Pandoraea sp. PE-S2T-3]